MRGSLSTTCESVGGQCPCKEGYIGKHCNLCEIGYYGIDDEDGQCKGEFIGLLLGTFIDRELHITFNHCIHFDIILF